MKAKSIVITAAAGIIIGLLVGIFVTPLFAQPPAAEKVEVANVVGKPLTEAVTALESSDLKVEFQATVAQDKAEYTVLSQKPAAAEKADKGSTVVLTIAVKDANISAAPNVTGMTKADAQKVLEDAGLKVEFQEEENKDVAAGCVAKQNPAAKAPVKKGDTVTLTIAKAVPSTEQTTVPDLTGLTQADAEKKLTEAKLVPVAGNAEVNTTVAPGTVFKQSIGAGENVAVGAQVTFTIAMNENLVTVPCVEGKTVAEATEILKKAGFGVDTFTIHHSTVPEGSVVEHNPYDGVRCAEGTTIYLAVSAGPAGADTVTVPNLVTLNWEQAQSVCEAAGLTLKGEKLEDGVIVEQNIAAGTKVDVGSTISVTLSVPNSGNDNNKQ